MIVQIVKAMDAHSNWRKRLEYAIETGVTDLDVDLIKTDKHCAFGKWLNGKKLTPQVINSDIYKQVKEIHAQFHIEASRIAELATAGKKAEAYELLEPYARYNQVSIQLMKKLLHWKEQLTNNRRAFPEMLNIFEEEVEPAIQTALYL